MQRKHTRRTKRWPAGMVVVISVAMAVGCKRTAPSPTAPGGKTAGPQAAAGLNASALIEMNNRGVGLMGKFEYEAARELFQQVADQDPDRLEFRVNLAIATLNRQREGDEDAALKMLEDVLKRDSAQLRAQYCSGLLKLYLQSPEDALSHFQFVAEADSTDPYAAYYVGQCLAQGRRAEEAAAWFDKAIQLDPYLRSAYYAAAQALRAADRDQESRAMLEAFQKLEKNPRARLVEFKYKRMGPKGEAVAVNLATPPPPSPRPDGPIFLDPVPLLANGEQFTWKKRELDRAVSITACDIDHDGDIDIFIADVLDQEGLHNAVCVNQGDGRFLMDDEHILATIPSVNAALWGDYDNDGLTDVYLCRRGPNMLWRQAQNGIWTDVTASTQTGNGEFDTVDGALVDFDHDGDLDIFCVNGDGPNELLNNNLDGTFRGIAQERGIAGSGKGSRQVLPVDLDSDRDLDIIVINREPAHDIYINDRLWDYHRAKRMDQFEYTLIDAIVASDNDCDGQIELYTCTKNPIDDQPTMIGRWQPAEDGMWSFEEMKYPPDFGRGRDRVVEAIALADGTGSGKSNFITFDKDGSTAVWDFGFGLVGDLGPIVGDRITGRAVVTLSAAGPGIVVCIDAGAPMICRPGPGRHQFATLNFRGKKDADTMRSNASGIGTHFAARVDSMWVAGSTLRNSSGPGQSLQPIAIGLAGHDKVDFISIDWSDGVFQSEVDLEAGKHHVIAETQRQLSSCPVLFAWNGTEFEFITDALGVGGIGYMVAPGTYAPSRPWEHLLLPYDALKANNGRFQLKLSEPMEEACYLDAAKLVAYDVPPGWKMTLDERMSINGPEPTGEPVFYCDEILPARALNQLGEDVLDAIIRTDLRAAPVSEIDPRFIGRLKNDHVLTLEFDRALDRAPKGKPLLIIDGWVEYPYSQTMFAAWQAGAEYRAPTIEALDKGGQWQLVLEQFGYPAGMPRQMSIPLANLPAGTKSLRLITNQEIYFDRIAVAYAEPCPNVVRHEVNLKEAELRQTGFAYRTSGPQKQPRYDYDRRVPYWDTRYQRGLYSAIGAVHELVAQHDDAVAIFGAGEEVHLEFVAELPPVPFTLRAESEELIDKGAWTRRFVLELRGWCKDMDLFTKDGETIEPLPRSGTATSEDRRDDLHRRHNARFEAGK